MRLHTIPLPLRQDQMIVLVEIVYDDGVAEDDEKVDTDTSY